MVTWIRRTSLVFVLSSAALVSACSGASTNTGAASTTAAVRVSSSNAPLRMIAESLADVTVRPDQKKEIDALLTQADTRGTAGQTARKEMMLAVASQIEAGAIDRAALAPKLAAIVDAADQTRTADRAALERLHAILSPEQRRQFANAMEVKMSSHRGPRGDHAEHEKHAKGPGDHREGPFGFFKGLSLSDEQKAKLKAAFQSAREHIRGDGGEHGRERSHADGPRPDGASGEGHHEHARGPGADGAFNPHARAKRMVEAFRQDKFVMDEPVAKEKMHAPIDKMLGFAETALPILTPEQRVVLANVIRARAEHADEHH